MAKLTISKAARVCGVARTTLQRAVKTGRLSLDAEHRVDTAELLRAGYPVDAETLYVTMQQTSATTQQDAAPQHSRETQHVTQQTQQDAAPLRSTLTPPHAVLDEVTILRRELGMVQAERDRLAQQVVQLL